MKTLENFAFVSVVIRESSSERLQPFKGITMNGVTCCFSQDKDSANDKVFTLFKQIDAFQDQRKSLESFMPKLDSVMEQYSAMYWTLKKRGEDIETRIDQFTGSERENTEVSEDIASLSKQWDSFEKTNQDISETLKMYGQELQRVDEGIQTKKEAIVKLIETGFERSQNSQMINETLKTCTNQFQQLDEGTQTEKEKVVKLTETHDVQELRE